MRLVPFLLPNIASLFSNQNSPKIDQLLIHLSQIDSVHMLDMFGAWATQWLSKNRHLTNNKWHSSHSYNHEIARVQLCNIPSCLPWLNPLPFSPQQKRRNTFDLIETIPFPCVFFQRTEHLFCAGIFPPSFREKKIRWNDQCWCKKKNSNSSFSKPTDGWKIVWTPCWYGMIRSPPSTISPTQCLLRHAGRERLFGK